MIEHLKIRCAAALRVVVVDTMTSERVVRLYPKTRSGKKGDECRHQRTPEASRIWLEQKY